MTDANDRIGVGVEYVPDRDCYVGSFDENRTEPSRAVVDAVAAVMHCDPMDMEPLYRSVDTEALDSIVVNTNGTGVTVSFDVSDLRVTVSCDGTIEIEPPDPNRPDS